MGSVDLVQVIASYGFPAFFAVVLFITYKEMVNKVIEVVEANTRVVQNVGNVMADFATRIDRLEQTVARIADK